MTRGSSPRRSGAFSSYSLERNPEVVELLLAIDLAPGGNSRLVQGRWQGEARPLRGCAQVSTMRKLQIVAVMILGSFLVYCGQNASPGDGGLVTDAGAGEACGCTEPQTFT